MPYNPGIQDISGQLIAQGINQGAGSIANLFERLRERSDQTRELRTTLGTLYGGRGTESNPAPMDWSFSTGSPEGAGTGTGEGTATEQDQEKYKNLATQAKALRDYGAAGHSLDKNYLATLSLPELKGLLRGTEMQQMQQERQAQQAHLMAQVGQIAATNQLTAAHVRDLADKLKSRQEEEAFNRALATGAPNLTLDSSAPGQPGLPSISDVATSGINATGAPGPTLASLKAINGAGGNMIDNLPYALRTVPGGVDSNKLVTLLERYQNRRERMPVGQTVAVPGIGTMVSNGNGFDLVKKEKDVAGVPGTIQDIPGVNGQKFIWLSPGSGTTINVHDTETPLALGEVKKVGDEGDFMVGLGGKQAHYVSKKNDNGLLAIIAAMAANGGKLDLSKLNPPAAAKPATAPAAPAASGKPRFRFDPKTGALVPQ